MTVGDALEDFTDGKVDSPVGRGPSDSVDKKLERVVKSWLLRPDAMVDGFELAVESPGSSPVVVVDDLEGVVESASIKGVVSSLLVESASFEVEKSVAAELRIVENLVIKASVEVSISVKALVAEEGVLVIEERVLVMEEGLLVMEKGLLVMEDSVRNLVVDWAVDIVEESEKVVFSLGSWSSRVDANVPDAYVVVQEDVIVGRVASSWFDTVEEAWSEDRVVTAEPVETPEVAAVVAGSVDAAEAARSVDTAVAAGLVDTAVESVVVFKLKEEEEAVVMSVGIGVDAVPLEAADDSVESTEVVVVVVDNPRLVRMVEKMPAESCEVVESEEVVSGLAGAPLKVVAVIVASLEVVAASVASLEVVASVTLLKPEVAVASVASIRFVVDLCSLGSEVVV